MRDTATVRLATPADVPAIADVCIRGTRQACDGLVTPDYIDRVARHWYGARRLLGELAPDPPGWMGYLVALLDGEVRGVAGCGLVDIPGTCELYVLYVDPQRQRRGVGRALLEAVRRQAMEAGATRLEAAVMPGNVRATAFYEAQGFTAAGTRPVYAPHGAHGGPADVLIYAHDMSRSA